MTVPELIRSARWLSPGRFRYAFAGTLLLLASCVPKIVAPPIVPLPHNALAAGVRPGPAITSFGIDPYSYDQALQAFKISCRSLLARTDTSGLTRPQDWQNACLAAPSWAGSALQFFTTYFETAEIGGGKAFATGYYEPEIAGSRVKAPGYEIPVYAKPADLLDANPVTGERGRGRLDEHGNYVLYYDRGQIEDGALAGRGLEIAWVADPVAFFILQIQGSGRLSLPDGSVMRIGYASQNGREYVGIGRIMRERGLLQPGGTSMQHIAAWLRANPEEGRAIMRENKSYIFFKEQEGAGPLGALGLPVTPRASVAADPQFIPLGAPVLLALDKKEANGIWIAQDTGGAIKGANRFDTFWGAGEDAAQIAGGLTARGNAYILLPVGTLANIERARTHASPTP